MPQASSTKGGGRVEQVFDKNSDLSEAQKDR